MDTKNQNDTFSQKKKEMPFVISDQMVFNSISSMKGSNKNIKVLLIETSHTNSDWKEYSKEVRHKKIYHIFYWTLWRSLWTDLSGMFLQVILQIMLKYIFISGTWRVSIWNKSTIKDKIFKLNKYIVEIKNLSIDKHSIQNKRTKRNINTRNKKKL